MTIMTTVAHYLPMSTKEWITNISYNSVVLVMHIANLEHQLMTDSRHGGQPSVC